MKLVDIEPLMKNGWHLVQTGESNRFLRSMSLADVPTVDAVEVVHGRWILKETCGAHTEKFHCSVCDKIPKSLCTEDYCPNCGAKMDG